MDQHEKTSKRQQKCDQLRKSKVSQLSLHQSFSIPSSSTSLEQQYFNLQLCVALISANILLYNVQNYKFKLFLEKLCNKTAPRESALRRNYVTPLYDNVILEIKNRIREHFFYIIVNETTDVAGRYLVASEPGYSMFIFLNIFFDTNYSYVHSSMVQFNPCPSTSICLAIVKSFLFYVR